MISTQFKCFSQGSFIQNVNQAKFIRTSENVVRSIWGINKGMEKARIKDKSVDGKVKVGQMHSELFLKHLQGSVGQVCLAPKCHHKSHNPIMLQHPINCD